MTVTQAISRIRRRVRDRDGTYWTDAEILDAINEVIGIIHRHLDSIGSVLVYEGGSFTTIEGVAEYQIGSQYTLVRPQTLQLVDGDNRIQLKQYHPEAIMHDPEATGRPVGYHLIPIVDGVQRISLWPIPDGQYKIEYHYMIVDPTIPESAIGTNAVLPYGGIWDVYIVTRAALMLQDEIDAASQIAALQMVDVYNQAMQATYAAGVRRVTMIDPMFFVGGT